MKRLICEFLGTFFLVLTVALSGNPLAIGVVLAIMIYTFGYISGGHYNPAVTVAMIMNKKIKPDEGLRYILSQFIGGITASLVYLWTTGKYFGVAMPSGVSFFAAFLIETIFTFALVIVIFNVAVNEKTKNNQYFGAAIGLTIFVAVTAGGAISGGAFNPAVGISPYFLNLQSVSANWGSIVLYIVGPILGAIIAAFVNRVMTDEIKLKM